MEHAYQLQTITADNKSDSGNIILTNRISLLLTLLPVIYIVFNVVDQGWARITTPILLQPAFFLLPILFNFLGLNTLSKICLSWAMPLQAMIFSIYNKSLGLDLETSHYLGIRFSIVASSVIPILIFRLKDSNQIIISISLSVITLVWFDSIHDFFGVGYYQVGLEEKGYSLTTMRVLIAFLLVVGSSIFLKQLNEKKEAVNQKLISDMAEKNREILGHLREIEHLHEKVLDQNALLSGKNFAIQNQHHEILSQKEQITRQKEELEKKQSQLIQSKKMASLGQMTSSIAHEINNPLNFISGGVQGLTYSVRELVRLVKNPFEINQTSVAEIEQEANALVGNITNGVFMANRIVKSLRTFSSPQASAITEVNVQDTLEMAVTMLHSKIVENNIKVFRNYSDRIKTMVGNPSELSQVFSNIIDNAIQAMEGTIEQKELHLTTHVADDLIIIAIRDTGGGIPSEIRDKIVEPFFTTKPVGKGTGLGLSISYDIVEKHKGEMSFSSEVGMGTTFTLIFKTN